MAGVALIIEPAALWDDSHMSLRGAKRRSNLGRTDTRTVRAHPAGDGFVASLLAMTCAVDAHGCRCHYAASFSKLSCVPRGARFYDMSFSISVAISAGDSSARTGAMKRPFGPIRYS